MVALERTWTSTLFSASDNDWCMQVDELPRQDEASRRSTLADLTAAPPSQDLWQVGGSTNFTIAAARLGLNVCCCGNVGDDAFGMYLLACLEVRLRKLLLAAHSTWLRRSWLGPSLLGLTQSGQACLRDICAMLQFNAAARCTSTIYSKFI